MDYRVNPAGVQTVLTKTGTTADGFVDDLTPLQTALPDAMTGCGESAIIGGALQTFLGTENKRMTGVMTRVKACITGATLATVAYVHGDHAMMATAQQNASKAKISDMPAKWLKKH